MTFKIHEGLKKYSKYCTSKKSIDTLAWQWTYRQNTDFGHFLKRASQIWYFRLVTTLDVYIMSHTGQFDKLLFDPDTQPSRRHDIIYRVDVDSKYHRCTSY